ncbi:putative ATP-dependent RNA helicase TDRD12 isoform X2 [Sipha flava]|uniref:RNA helicase n=1 Tax=Sipha flava TaxID=143950 RepID=A0A8B8GCK7_9HEMI|nr:putative ATP-dependent RNA helicase TDRD12 isoform X2 [Sipha flava]
MFDQMNLHKYSDLQYDASKNNRNATPVYGPFEKLFVSDWGQSKIHHNVIQAFDKMNIRTMSPLQQNSFLYLSNNYNTAMVGYSRGKSFSYLVSIFSSILNNRVNDETDLEIGPKAIVLSSSLGSCSELEDLSKKLTSPRENSVKVVVAYASMPVQHTIAHICNGCDVLITTPASLHNLLNKTKIFSWMNLRHVVFDNIDVLLVNYKDEMVYFYKIFIQLKESISNLQMISASVKWTKEVDDFLNRLFVKWQYIFGSHLEAARYMKIGFHFVHFSDNKLDKLLDYLNNNIKCRRSVLFTSNTDELTIISNYIQQNESDIEVLLPSQMKSAKVYTLQKWDMPLAKNKLILICSDDMMFDFYIDNADCVIHYDIPIDKQKFSTRFSVLQNSNNILTIKERSTYIFLSNNTNDMLQLPKVVEIMKEFGNGKVEPILQKHAMNISKTLEKQKVNRLLCINVKQFGNCLKPSVCPDRHILFKEVDEPAVNIPKSGLAIIKVLTVYDASHLSAKLLKLNCTNSLNNNTNWSNVKDHTTAINHELNMFYSNEDSRILHENPKYGDIVAVQLYTKKREEENTEYFRAIIIGFLDTNTINSKVEVKLIDEGFVDTISIWKIFVLPDSLKSLETNTVDIFLASVKPIDFDQKWCKPATTRVRNDLNYAKDCNDTIIVKVEMALGTTLWIKKLYKKNWNSNLKQYDFIDILPGSLLNFGYADKNFDHITKLTDLCTAAGINLPSTLKQNVENHELTIEEFMSFYKLPQPQWAHLDKTSETLVTLNYIISPKLFFVLNTKYYDMYNNLQEKICNYVEQKQGNKLKHIIKGAICLAQHPVTIQYGRVQIIEVLNSRTVEVLFVDLGYIYEIKTNSLLTIQSNLITQLPFQAIECSLSGVKDTLPTGDKLEELTQYVLDLTEHIYLKVHDTISSAKISGGNHYEVILYDENNTVNFEFKTNFPEYCDSLKMSELIDLYCNKDIVEENDFIPQNLFEDRISEIENNVEVEDLDSTQLFFQEFGHALLGSCSIQR